MGNHILTRTREMSPIIHNITNHVSANDCANITLACGASPIMAEELMEMEEITALSSALVINTGVLTEGKLKSMRKAGQRSNELQHPVILDPVGIGASHYRREAILQLLSKIRFRVIRGNASEIKVLHEMICPDSLVGANLTRTLRIRGVDVSEQDKITMDRLEQAIWISQELSRSTGAIIVVTGATDIITEGNDTNLIYNGHPMLGKVAGSGCMLSSLIGAYCGANPKDCLSACIAAVGAMGLGGELAYEKILSREEGTASFRTYLIDYISRLEGGTLEDRIRFERRKNSV